MIKNLTLVVTIVLASAVAQADQCAWVDSPDDQRIARIIERVAGLTDDNPAIYELCEICADAKLYEADMGMVRFNLKSDSANVASKDAVRTKFADMKYNGQLDVSPEYREVELSLKEGGTYDIDAAYMYVETAPDIYTNLAYLSGCPFQGVSPQVKLNTRVNKVINKPSDL